MEKYLSKNIADQVDQMIPTGHANLIDLTRSDRLDHTRIIIIGLGRTQEIH